MPQAISQTHSSYLSFFTYRLETTVILILGLVDFSFELKRAHYVGLPDSCVYVSTDLGYMKKIIHVFVTWR